VASGDCTARRSVIRSHYCLDIIVGLGQRILSDAQRFFGLPFPCELIGNDFYVAAIDSGFQIFI